MNTEVLPEEAEFGRESANAIIARDRLQAGHPGTGFAGLSRMLRKGWQSMPAQVARGGTKAVFDAGPMAGAAGGGAVGAGLGYGVGKLLDWTGDDEGWRGRIGALLGGLAGAGLGAYAGYKRAGSELSVIQSALGGDGSISNEERATLMRGVAQLGQSDINLLAQLIRTVGGAAVGVLIAKFLFKAGLGGSLLGGLLGGFAGSSLAGKSQSGKTDIYGSSYRI